MVDEIGNCCCETIRSVPPAKVNSGAAPSRTLWLSAAAEVRIHSRRRRIRRSLTLDDADFFFRKFRNRICGKAQILRQHFGRRPRHPIGDAKRPELRESAVVEDEQKVALARPEALNECPCPLGNTQMSPGPKSEISAFPEGAMTVTRAAARDHVRPLCRDRMPVQLSQRTRLKPHGYCREALGNGELIHGVLPSRAGSAAPPLRLFEIEFEIRKIAHESYCGAPLGDGDAPTSSTASGP